MQQLPREFVGRTVRAILFIGLVAVFCTAVSSAGLLLASRFGLTRSREQVPLTGLSIAGHGEVELPQRGKAVEGEGWKLRNSRDIYTLTLDNAMIESAAPSDSKSPAIAVHGDLIIELKQGSGNWVKSQGVGILETSGTLVIRGKGSLNIEAGDTAIWCGDMGKDSSALRLEGGHMEIEAGYTGVAGTDIELAGAGGIIQATQESGIGIRAVNFKVEPSAARISILGNGGAVIAANAEPDFPSIRISDKTGVFPQSAGIIEQKSAYTHKGGSGNGDGGYNILTFTSGDRVIYHEASGCFEGAEKEIAFMGK